MSIELIKKRDLMSHNNENYIKAIDLALQGKWDDSHLIVQELNTTLAQRIHAVLHKIEGDESNSRYWYGRSGYSFDEFVNSTEELQVIKASIIK